MARILGGAVLILLGIALASLGLGQGSLSPPAGPPAPTMKSLQQVSDQLASLTALNPVQKFSDYIFGTTPASAGGLRCTPLGLPAGSVVKLESVVGATYNDTAPVAYLRYLVKEGGASSRIVIQRVNLDTAIADPVANSRSFNEPLALWISGGDVFDVQDFESAYRQRLHSVVHGSLRVRSVHLDGHLYHGAASG